MLAGLPDDECGNIVAAAQGNSIRAGREKINAVPQGSHMKIDVVLAELKIPREAYRVIMLMPLVYVAWADGKIQSQERKLIMSIAEERGLLDQGGRGCLER